MYTSSATNFLPPYAATIFPKSIDGLEEEILFVKDAFSNQGFYPQEGNLHAFRGDSRSPEEIIQANGFYRKAFKDISKSPAYRANGCVVNMIGCSTDFKVAVGFTNFPVHIQRNHGDGQSTGWVYSFYIPSNTYFNPRDYSNAFLGEWGKEIDAIYIPLDHIIGAVQIEHPTEKLCIHNYLTHVPDYIHRRGGCQAHYVDSVNLKIKSIWKNNFFNTHLNQIDVENHFTSLSIEKGYTLQPLKEDSDHAKLIKAKFDNLMKICEPFEKPFWSLTVHLKPTPQIVFLPENE